MKQDTPDISNGNNSKVSFRFYAELNDFLRIERRQEVFDYPFHGPLTIREAIESLGIPHTNVDLVLVNGQPVDFTRKLRNNDFISVYPVFETFDISDISKIRRSPLRIPRFVVDAHLGKLAKYLRIMGFDSLYRNDYRDDEIRFIASLQHRIILTRDKELLMSKKVNHGYYVRSVVFKEQVVEVLNKFDLYSGIKPLSRCIICNHKLHKVSVASLSDKINPEIGSSFDEFFKCRNCKKIYWKGSHYKRMSQYIEQFLLYNPGKL
ncbi:MAG: Mut7-C RNAse domain-containing protein [Bacteroidota bacterium]|nr:Mut7-C RNAse domain-containing protein [Bacteroidota bacterium]